MFTGTRQDTDNKLILPKHSWVSQSLWGTGDPRQLHLKDHPSVGGACRSHLPSSSPVQAAPLSSLVSCLVSLITLWVSSNLVQVPEFRVSAEFLLEYCKPPSSLQEIMF